VDPGPCSLCATCVANLYAAAAFLYSCEKSICRNNSFAFQGNDVIIIEENLGEKRKLATLDCDYNNYGIERKGYHCQDGGLLAHHKKSHVGLATERDRHWQAPSL
jgi:hypothetical protein